MEDRSVLREFCAENLTDIEAALNAGARRIELCDNLSCGGTTPSAGVIEQAIALVHACEGASVRVIIRPRGGDFAYNKSEFKAMETDIRYAAANGVDGVVLGCLKRAGDVFELDIEGAQRLISVARSVGEMRGRELGITFHMAFDELDPKAQLKAIDTLADMGVDHILTHGGRSGTPIEENLSHLADLVQHAKGKLVILPGGGVTYENVKRIAKELGVKEAHGTKIVDLNLGLKS